jgi:hypothetical protein
VNKETNMETTRAPLSAYGLRVEDLMQARGMCGGALLVEELQGVLEDEAGLTISRETLAEHLSGAGEENNLELLRPIIGGLDLDEGETKELTRLLYFHNFGPAR